MQNQRYTKLLAFSVDFLELLNNLRAATFENLSERVKNSKPENELYDRFLSSQVQVLE